MCKNSAMCFSGPPSAFRTPIFTQDRWDPQYRVATRLALGVLPAFDGTHSIRLGVRGTAASFISFVIRARQASS